jgi:sirohydrochlorin ferrochelatase
MKAVILLGHGSRAQGAADDMEKVVARLKETLDYDIVVSCQMSGLGVQFPDAFDKCVGLGATEIIVIPYFLHFGVHLRQDVPEMMREKLAEYPNVKAILGKNLGFDEALVDIVRKRIAESEDSCDVRELGDQV